MKTILCASKLSLFALFIFCLPVQWASAQQNKQDKPFEKHLFVQPKIGLTEYFGDINPDDLFNKNPKLGIGLDAGYQFSPVLGLRADFMNTKLYSEKSVQDKKLNSKLFDINAELTIDITEWFLDYKPDRFANVYLLGGLGYTSYKSKLERLSTGALMYEHDSRQSEFVLPFGGGVGFRINNNLRLNMEYVSRITNHDDKMDFQAKLQKRDWYSFASAGLQIKLGCNDKDGDGVVDKKDVCPDIPGKVELAGCPDRDGDGIADKDDQCPDVFGLKEFQGCPDTDGDGIPDKGDACPTQIGKSNLNGCPDRDGDGIADKDDQCPDVPGSKELIGCPDKDGDGIADKDDKCPDVAGLKELNGCPDRDGDGIADIDDSCPDIKGLSKFAGCPDTDGDGIADNLDKCPTVFGIASNKGCPEVKAETQKIFDQALKGIQFETNKDVIKPVSYPILEQVVKVMKDNPAYLLEINGHTDNVGDDVKNLDLSQRRAIAVKNYLVKKGIEAARLTPKGFGETQPVADNKTANGRAKNRRVEFKVNF